MIHFDIMRNDAKSGINCLNVCGIIYRGFKGLFKNWKKLKLELHPLIFRRAIKMVEQDVQGF